MRFAVLGLGSAGARHASNLLDLGYEVVAWDPQDRDPPPNVRSAEGEDAAIGAADAVVVASPSSEHARQAIAALEAGCHVLVDKPLATTAGDAATIAELARTCRLVCAVGMNLRFHPPLLALKRLVDEGNLGQIMLLEATFGYDLRLWRPETDYRMTYSGRSSLGGGIVLDAIHELDYILWLLGSAESVVAMTGHVSNLEIDVEDVALAALRMRSGAMASVSLNFFEPAYRRGCILVGEAAVARWNWHAPEVEVRRRDGSVRTIAAEADVSRSYRELASDFAQAVTTGVAPRTPASEGVAAVMLAEALKQSAASGRRISLSSA